MSASNYLEAALLNATLRNTSYTSPATVYVALFTTNPDEPATGTEVSASGYARQSAAFAAPSGGACLNSALITFGPAGASWGTITHAAIFDASSGGNMLYYGALSVNKAIATNDSFTFAAGSLSVSAD